MGHSRSFNWLRKLKDVAYDVDDVVDEFQIETEKQHDTDGGSDTMSQYLCKNPKSFMIRYKAAHKIKAIKKRFAVIVKQRIDITAEVGHPIHHLNKTTVAMPSPRLPIIDEAAIVGRNQDKNNIITKLVKHYGQQETEIVSIIGMGGTGKTTLARLILSDGEIIRNHFEPRLWVHVSQEYSITKLVEKLFVAITKEKSDQHTLEHMSDTILEKLTRKKILLVLDDIWIEDRSQYLQFREEFMVHLKRSSSGSKILLTTRSKRVAEAMESTELYDLPFLSLGDSWQLFHRSFGEGLTKLGDEFQQIGKEIVGKCGGVPLAIKSLACTLRDKELIGEWKALRDSSLLQVEGEESVSACLKLSYFYLPSHLKQCFTLCSLFPKGHLIYKQQLIDLWIVHDTVSLTPGVDDLDHIGHRYFNSLVQVSFLEVEDEDNERVSYKMHDLIHDLARSILCEEISTIMPEDATRSKNSYRYFSLIKQSINISSKRVFKKARSIYIDGGNDLIFGKALKNAKHLRSIIIENSISSTPELMAIFQAKNLKYLEMSGFQCEALPEAITDVQSLQALYLESSYLLELPESIGKLKNLRTLNISRCYELKSLPDSIGDCQRLKVLRLYWSGILGLPSGITTLQNLEYLEIEGCSKLVGLPEGIGNLTKLKELDLNSSKRWPPGIWKLTQLEKLNTFRVETDNRYARISELATLSRISGKLSIFFLRDLTDQSEARQACLKQKEKLHELKLLWGSLDDRENPEQEVVALDGLEPPSGIQCLEISKYAGGRFASWMLNQASGRVQWHGQFPFLTRMSLYDFPNLKHLDELVQLPCLEELHLVNMPALESISGGPFPSLAKVILYGLPSLGVVWVGKEGEGCSNHNHHQSRQLQIGSRLTDLCIEYCPKLVVKPHLPISLEQLRLDNCNDNLLLSPCQGSSSSSNSAPSFIHLKVLELRCMKTSLYNLSLGLRLELFQQMSALQSLEIFLCIDLIELPKYLGNICSLQRITIKNCDLLSGLPQSTGQLICLQELIIKECPAIVQFPESLGELRSLRKFEIYDLKVLTCLPQSLCNLTSLRELSIEYCEALVQLPEALGELCSLCKLHIGGLPGLTRLPQSLCHIMSLQELRIGHCVALGELPEWLGELHSLRKLMIWGFNGTACLPQSLFRLTTSLKELGIWYCPGLKSLQEGIKGLSALQRLTISSCPDLEKRCESGTGEDWHLISHIPNLQIGYPRDGPVC